MFLKAIFAYFHYVSFIVMICAMVIELVLFKQTLSRKSAKIIQKADMFLGISAMSVIATGAIRFFYLEKGYEYYITNYLFVIKLILVLSIWLLSIYPTRVFIKWRKQLDQQSDLQINNNEYLKIKRMIRIEVILIFLIPLLAALASRGIGFGG